MTHQPRCTKCGRRTTKKTAKHHGAETFCGHCWDAAPPWMHKRHARQEAKR